MVACLASLLDHPETAGETYELGGPEVLSYGDFLRRTRAQLGHRLLVVPVPVITPGLSAYWLRLVTDVPQGVARPLVEGLRNPVVADDQQLFDLLGVERTPLDASIASALGPGRATVPPSPEPEVGSNPDRTERADGSGGGDE